MNKNFCKTCNYEIGEKNSLTFSCHEIIERHTDKLEMKTKWILETDELPQNNNDVLVYIESNDTVKGLTTAKYYKDEDHWELGNCLYDNCVARPSHWMPLPELPNAKELKK